MPITLNHSNISVQYSSDKSYIIETVKSDLYLRNENVDTVIRNNIQTASVTPATYVDSSGNVYAVESYTYSGTANTKDYTRVFPKNTTCDILVVGGGGGGGYHTGGGGGAGGYYYQTNVTISTGNYTISVGKGGNAGPDNNTRGGDGSDTTFYGITAKGGGGGASDNAPSGNSGGSGGGADWNGTAGLDTDTNTEGNNGGTPINIVNEYYGSGGGGAGSTGFTNGNGGTGKSNSITGTNTFYAAGGGGGRNTGTNWSGIGGSSIGGNGGNGTIAGTSGLNGTGSGGGGGGFVTGGSAGNGGSGIVIIRYLLGTISTTNFLTNEPVVTAPAFTESVKTFAHSGGAEAQTTHNITIGQNTICDILIVGGGGGGGYFGGGGGGGAILFANNLLLSAGNYTVKVGKGGTGVSTNSQNGNNGENSSITINSVEYIAKGGGGGGTRMFTDANGRNGNDGGSGGGGSHSNSSTIQGLGGASTKNTYTNWSSYGNNGGKGRLGVAGSDPNHASGGGGGAGSVGGDFTNSTGGGNGGAGMSFVSTFGTSVGHNGWFGGGGGGNTYQNVGNPGYGNGGNGLFGGGGNGGFDGGTELAAQNGLPNTGGGGGGSKYDGGVAADNDGGNGGSGFVIIKFKSITNAADSEGTPTITHKRLNFAYVPPLIYDFTPYNDLTSWKNYATSIGATTTNLDSFTFSGVFANNAIIGSIQLSLPSGYNQVKVNYNCPFTEAINLYIDDVLKDTCPANSSREYIQSYTAGQVLKIVENISVIGENLIITLTNTNTYSLNFPVPTLTDINNNSNIVLQGAYDISLNTSNAVIIPKNNQYIPKPTTFTNYSVERMYPPVRNFTAATTTVSGQTYGNGTYVVSFSATFGGGLDPWTCFNTSIGGGGHWTDRYTAGVFNSTSFIVSGYLGDWLKIQLPVAIKLTRFEFLMRNDAGQGGRDRSPKDFKIYGSNDNITWVELVNKTDAVYNASFKYEQTTPEITNTYTYYGLVVNKLFSSATVLNFDEWYIYGQEVLPSSLSLRYFLLNPILDPIGAQWTYSSNNTNVYHMGSVGIGTTSPEYHLDVRGNIYSSMGGFTQSGLTTWSITSDRRIKDNIVKASYDKCLENVKNIELYNFNFKDNYVNTNDRRQLGFIAQEVQQVYPKAVEVGKMIMKNNDGIENILSLNTTQIEYTLYGAVKKLIDNIEEMENEIADIENTSNITTQI